MLVEATEQHISSIVELVNFSYRAENHRGWTSEASIVAGDRINDQQLQNLIQSTCKVLLWLQDKQLIGCVQVQHHENVGYIGMLTIHPDFQNKGMGKRLLQAAERYLNEKYSICAFEMSVLSARTELLAFYQRCGYQLTSQIEDYPVNANIGQPLLNDLTVLHLIKTEQQLNLY